MTRIPDISSRAGMRALSLDLTSPRMTRVVLALTLLWVCRLVAADLEGDAAAPLSVPARSIPLPNTGSPEMQKALARPIPPLPPNPADWRALAAQDARESRDSMPALLKQSHASVTETYFGG